MSPICVFLIMLEHEPLVNMVQQDDISFWNKRIYLMMHSYTLFLFFFWSIHAFLHSFLIEKFCLCSLEQNCSADDNQLAFKFFFLISWPSIEMGQTKFRSKMSNCQWCVWILNCLDCFFFLGLELLGLIEWAKNSEKCRPDFKRERIGSRKVQKE